MIRTLTTLAILFAASSTAMAQNPYYYQKLRQKRMTVGRVTFAPGAQPYTPRSAKAARGMQIGAVTYFGGVRPFTPRSSAANRGTQVGAVTYFGVRPVTTRSPAANRGMQIGAVTRLVPVNRGYVQPQFRGRVSRGYVQPQFRRIPRR